MALIDRCIAARDSDFYLLAPTWTRDTISKAIDHLSLSEDPLPPYAVPMVNNALNVISKVNAKGKRNFEEAARMPRAHRKGVKV